MITGFVLASVVIIVGMILSEYVVEEKRKLDTLVVVGFLAVVVMLYFLGATIIEALAKIK